MKMKDKRLAHIRLLLETDPNDPFLHYAIGIEHFNAEDYPLAKQAFKELITSFPDYLPTYYQYALTLVHLQEINDAIGVIEQGIPVAQKAGDKKTANELAMLLDDLDD